MVKTNRLFEGIKSAGVGGVLLPSRSAPTTR